MKLQKAFALWIGFLLLNCIVHAEEFELRNKIVLDIESALIEQNGEYLYTFRVLNSKSSVQKIWIFRLIVSDEKLLSEIRTPQGWYRPKVKPLNSGHLRSIQKVAWVAWGAPESARINPGNDTKGFEFNSPYYSVPGIIDYYAEGYAPAPSFPEGEAPDHISGYHDLTPYGPGIVGKTIGPTAPPAVFKSIEFLDNIINMKHEAYKHGWIKNEGIVKSLDAKLDNAKKKLENGDTKAAKNILSAFINEVEAQGCANYENCPSGKHLTSEAYGLLKYNAQYLIDHLQ